MGKRIKKFSDMDDVLFAELQGLINWFAYRNRSENIMMGFDDIKQELEIELVKGIRYYRDKPVDERKKLLKTMLDHRVQEMKSMFYNTHRVLGNDYENIDELEVVSEVSPTEADSRVFIDDLKARLSPTSKEVLDVILVPNDNIANVLSMAYVRACKKRPKKRVRKPWYIIRPWHVSEATGLDLKTCRMCFREIKKVYHATMEVE